MIPVVIRNADPKDVRHLLFCIGLVIFIVTTNFAITELRYSLFGIITPARITHAQGIREATADPHDVTYTFPDDLHQRTETYQFFQIPPPLTAPTIDIIYLPNTPWSKPLVAHHPIWITALFFALLITLILSLTVWFHHATKPCDT